MVSPLLLVAFCIVTARAHLAVWNNGMYCRNGPQTQDNENAEEPANPLYMLPKSQWWFHHVDLCDEFPPPPGEFLEIPANNNFTVEIADNRAVTTLSYNGQYTSEWVDGQEYPDAFVS
ncbi:hypothetical protein H0H92_009269 [Tricholoma furcatifolium]|nr:hypothetical protein H0H92_009269 [Tricholoma furcatifolium]